ncbi:MAG TPA: hypothetical protein VI731_01035 [Bacteroidia bacterium]|nr:hypothetical protein [Bacteroidia bacterium]
MQFSQNPGAGRINLVISFAMVIVFLSLGFVFLFSDIWIDRYQKPLRNYMGGVLVAWAVYRSITVWLRYKRIKREEKND